MWVLPLLFICFLPISILFVWFWFGAYPLDEKIRKKIGRWLSVTFRLDSKIQHQGNRQWMASRRRSMPFLYSRLVIEILGFVRLTVKPSTRFECTNLYRSNQNNRFLEKIGNASRANFHAYSLDRKFIVGNSYDILKESYWILVISLVVENSVCWTVYMWIWN